MEDFTQKQAGEPLEVPPQRGRCPSQRKLEPIPSRLLISRLVDPMWLLSIVDPFSVTPSRYRIEPTSPRPLIPMLSFPLLDNQISLLPILSSDDISVDPFSVSSS